MGNIDQPIAGWAVNEPQPPRKSETKNHNTTCNRPMHPLMAAAHHNRTKSNLCRLPDTILIQLMQMSDKTTVECLRRCSRIFLRLFPAAYDSAQDFSLRNVGKFPWPVSTRKLSANENEDLLSLLARDAYCKDCLSARQAPNWQARVAALTKTYLHCSACNAEHPACLFSARERNRTWRKSKRICIGHQGHMRLCEHVTVPWSLVVSEAERRLVTDTSFEKQSYSTLATCTRREHTRSCGPRRSFFDWLLGDWAPEDRQIIKHRRCCPFNPTVTCTFRESLVAPPLAAFVVKLAWSGHMPLAMGLDGCFAAEDLERGLKRLYREQGHFICPRLSPGPVTGSGLCDPNRCDCVEYVGRTQTGWARPPIERRKRATCRFDRTLGLGHDSIAKHELKRLVPDGIRGQCYRQCSPGRPVDGCYDLQSAVIIGCEKDADCAVVSYQARVVVELHKSQQHLGNMNPNWYHALDPDSYSLSRDVEGFGVYWCRDEGCRNYYSFSRSRLRGVLKASEYSRI